MLIEECIKYHRNIENKVTMPGETGNASPKQWYLYQGLIIQ